MFALEATVWREFFAEVFFFFGNFLYFARGTNTCISNCRTERLAFLAGYEFFAISRKSRLIGIFFKYYTYNRQVRKHIEMENKVISITLLQFHVVVVCFIAAALSLESRL